MHFMNRTTFYSVLAVIFGWGALWSGHQALKINSVEIGNITNTANVLLFSNIPSKISSLFSNNNELTIMIGGDVMLDRNVRKIGEKSGYDSLFTDISKFFKKADIGIVNLEGPITSNPSKTLFDDGRTGKELVFTFSTTTAPVLASSGISIVSLANNHTDNFGESGLNETKWWLANSNIKYFGDPWNRASTDYSFTKNNVKVALVGYHAFQSGYSRTIDSIKSFKDKGYFVIVMPHWGDEYVSSSTPLLKEKARSFVDAGASAIIGSHPHVVMDHEWIGEVPVFYSLGNLLFDQYFSEEVMRGNIVELHLIKSGEETKLDRIKVFETSLKKRNVVEIDETPVEI